jgi:hypothetical protein
MALARVKTWNPGDVLTAADLNGEFNNVLNNPITLVSPTTGPINFNLQLHTNLLPGVITGTSGVSGQTLMVTSSGTPLAFGNPYLGSRVRNLQVIASSQNAQFTADEYVLKTSPNTQSFVMASTASFTVNLATAGPAANGKDQAGQFASTYIHYYAITTGAGSTTPAGIVSSQPPSVGPTLPAGYVAWAYLTSLVYSSASTTLSAATRQRGAWVWNDVQQTALSGAQSTTLASLPSAATVPSNAQNILFDTALNNQAGAAATVTIQVVSGSNTHVLQTATGTPASAPFTVPNTGTLFYVWSTNPNPGSVAFFTVGYSVPNGDAA